MIFDAHHGVIVSTL